MKRSLLAIAAAGALTLVLAGGAFFALKLTASGASVGPINMSSYPGNPPSGVTGSTTIQDCDGTTCPIPFTSGSGVATGITAWNAPAMNPPAYVALTYYSAPNCDPLAVAAVLVTDPMGLVQAPHLRLQDSVLKTGLLITPALTPYVGGTGPILSAGITVAAGDYQCSDNTDSDGDTLINDGCWLTNPIGIPPEAICNEAACPDADGQRPWDNCDDDADGAINEGCPANDAAEAIVIPDPPNYQYLACGNADGTPVTGWDGKLTDDWKLIPDQFSFAIDADPWNGTAPCNPIDDTNTVNTGDDHEVAVCTVNEPRDAGGVDPDDVNVFILFLNFDKNLNECKTNPDCDPLITGSKCLDDNPDVNAGSTLGSGHVPTTPNLGGSWDCAGAGAGIQPWCDDALGRAEARCLSFGGPWTSGGLSPFPLAVVSFKAIAPGTDTMATSDNVWSGKYSGEADPPPVSVSAEVHNEGTPPPPTATQTATATPTITPTPTITNTPTIAPTPTPTPIPDGDGDGVVDNWDACPGIPEDRDGFADNDGCPEADNDMDGICDPWYTPEVPACIGADLCPNVPETFDAFKDDDGCPDPDNDMDGNPDNIDQCPATDWTAGPDGIADTGDEPLDELGVPIKTREDYDGIIDWDGCHDSPGDDWDGDGLSDETEVLVSHTNPIDMDTDDDGLCDGHSPPTCASEDSNNNGLVDPGETNPLNWDSDGDGLSDGLERGLAAPETPDTSTSSPHWQPDSDPESTTDPLSPDTDGDGVSDGAEDANQNGGVDEGDTSPSDPDTDGDGFWDKPEDDLEGVNTDMTEDNCPLDYNPGQTNTDGQRRPNGSQIPGDWASNPTQDTWGDVCDTDHDNDGLADTSENDASCPYRLVGDSDGDGSLDGYEVSVGKNACNAADKPRCSGSLDTDGDGFSDCVEHSGYNTCAFAGDMFPGYSACTDPTDSDGDGCADWIEIVDVNGNRTANTVDVLVFVMRGMAGGPGDAIGDKLLDLNKNGRVNSVDVLLAAQNSSMLRPHSTCLPE